MHPAIEACLASKRGLLIFPTYLAQRQWLDDNAELLFQFQVIHNKQMNELLFPNGNKLVLGHGTSDEDLLRYAGSIFNFVLGTNMLQRLVRP